MSEVLKTNYDKIEETKYEDTQENECSESNGRGVAGKVIIGLGMLTAGVVGTVAYLRSDEHKQKKQEKKEAKEQAKLARKIEEVRAAGYGVFKDGEFLEEGVDYVLPAAEESEEDVEENVEG